MSENTESLGGMEVVVKRRPRMTIAEFAAKHGLRVEVVERSRKTMPDESRRFYAHFAHAEIRSGVGGLLSTFGNGADPHSAIAAYAGEISEELLILNAMGPNRREIPVPILTHATPTESNP